MLVDLTTPPGVLLHTSAEIPDVRESRVLPEIQKMTYTATRGTAIMGVLSPTSSMQLIKAQGGLLHRTIGMFVYADNQTGRRLKDTITIGQ